MAFTMSEIEASGVDQTFEAPSTTDSTTSSIILTDEVDVALSAANNSRSLNDERRVDSDQTSVGTLTVTNENSEMTTTPTKPTSVKSSTVGDYENTTQSNNAYPSTPSVEADTTEAQRATTSDDNMDILTVNEITTNDGNVRNVLPVTTSFPDTTALPSSEVLPRKTTTEFANETETTETVRTTNSATTKSRESSTTNEITTRKRTTVDYTTPETITTNSAIETTQKVETINSVFGKVSSAGTFAASTFVPLVTGGDDEVKGDNTLLIVAIVCVIVGLILGIVVAVLAMTYCKKRRSKLKRRPTVPSKNPQEKTFERLDFSLSRTRNEPPDDEEEDSCYKRYDDPFPASDCDEVDAISYLSERPIRSSTYNRRTNTFEYNRVSRASSSLYSTQDEASNLNYPHKLRGINRPSSCDTYGTELAEDSSDAGACKKTISAHESAGEPSSLSEGGGHVNTSFNDGKDVIPPPTEFAEKSYENEDEESHSGNSSVSYFDIQILPTAFQSPYKVSAVASGMDTPTHHCSNQAIDL